VPKAYFREDSGMGGGEVGQRPHSNNAGGGPPHPPPPPPQKKKPKKKKKKKNKSNLWYLLLLICKSKDHQVEGRFFFPDRSHPTTHPKKNNNLRINPNLLVLPLICKMKDHQVACDFIFPEKFSHFFYQKIRDFLKTHI
jgi:hypothetical protein